MIIFFITWFAIGHCNMIISAHLLVMTALNVYSSLRMLLFFAVMFPSLRMPKYFSCDKFGQAPIHVAAHWKLRDMLRMLLVAESDVNMTDYGGKTPLYVCVSSLSTGLYKEDLKYQVPSMKMLFSAGCDMLNLVDWLKWKGPGIPQQLLVDDERFSQWYSTHMNSPLSLLNLCRKVIQQRLSERHDFVKVVPQLPLPHTLRIYLSRKMFHLPKP